MAKILCSISGIEFQCEHFPVYLHAREIAHPVFYLSQKKLLGFSAKWAAGELTPTDSYLLFLALLESTEQIEFRVPVSRNQNTDSIVANNMEDLIQIVGKINVIKHPAFVLPRFAVTPETKFLDTVHYWIKTWEEAYQDFLTGYRKQQNSEKILKREEALEKIIKDPCTKEGLLASRISEWAELAGDFPKFSVQTQFGTLECSEYWKLIIRKCANQESIFAVPTKDLEELIEHCELNILHGSIYAHTLMSILRKGKQRQNNFLGLGDSDLSISTYRILSDTDSIEDANKLAMIDSAPTEQPKPESYPSKLAYLRAKVKYEMAQDYKKQQAENKIMQVSGVGEI